MLTVEIPIADRKKPPLLKFPERCVNCGRPKHTVMPLKLDMGVQTKKGGVLMDLPVPLCADCERKERRITNVTLLPFTIVGFLLCGLVFVPVWLLTPDGNSAQTLGFSVSVGVLAGIVVGVLGGTVVEFFLKFLFVPVYGQLLWKRPLTILGLFNESENVIGLSLRFTEGKKALRVTFENDEIGREFEKLNLSEK